MSKLITLNDLAGRPMCDYLDIKAEHFFGLFRQEEPPSEDELEYLINPALRYRLVYLLTEYGDNAKVIAEELDAMRGFVPHAWAEENPKWALIFKTYADTLASAGAVAATKARHQAQQSFLTRWWNNIKRRKLMRQRAKLMLQDGFTLIG